MHGKQDCVIGVGAEDEGVTWRVGPRLRGGVLSVATALTVLFLVQCGSVGVSSLSSQTVTTTNHHGGGQPLPPLQLRCKPRNTNTIMSDVCNVFGEMAGEVLSCIYV